MVHFRKKLYYGTFCKHMLQISCRNVKGTFHCKAREKPSDVTALHFNIVIINSRRYLHTQNEVCAAVV